MLTYFMPYLADKFLNIVIEIEIEIDKSQPVS